MYCDLWCTVLIGLLQNKGWCHWLCVKGWLMEKSVIFTDILWDAACFAKNCKSLRHIETKFYFANSPPYEEIAPQLTKCKGLSWFHPEIEISNAEHPCDVILGELGKKTHILYALLFSRLYLKGRNNSFGTTAFAYASYIVFIS